MRTENDSSRILMHSLFQGCACKSILVGIVKVIVKPEEGIGKVVEISLDDVPDRVSLLRDVVRPDARERIEYEQFGHVSPARQDVADAGHVGRKLRIVIPPGVMIELGRRPIPLSFAFDRIVVPVIVEEVHTEDVFPVRDPLHPLQGTIPVGASHGLAEHPGTSEMMGRRAGNFQRNVLVRLLLCSDLGVQVVDADEVHLLEILEEIPLAAGVHPDPFFKEQVAGEDHAILFAPIVNALVVGFRILFGQRAPEVVADTGGFLPHVRVERGQVRTEVISSPLAEDLEHAARPGDHEIVDAYVIVVHRRLVRVETRDRGAEILADGGLVALVRQLDETVCGLRIERVDIVRHFFFKEVEQPPLSGGGFPGNHPFERKVLRQVDGVANLGLKLFLRAAERGDRVVNRPCSRSDCRWLPGR